MNHSTSTDDGAPPWLWKLASRGFVAAVIAVLALAVALALGAADPPRAGPFLWQDDFKGGAGRWHLLPPANGTLAAADGALVATFAPEATLSTTVPWALALTPGPAGDFTLEVAETAVSGQTEAAYGLVFAWQDASHYNALFVNGNGYAEVYQQAGTERRDWFEWQQWPHILFGTDTNRLRVDVRGQAVTLRINDEVLAGGQMAGARGQMGIVARSGAAARVVFSWVRLWGTNS